MSFIFPRKTTLRSLNLNSKSTSAKETRETYPSSGAEMERTEAVGGKTTGEEGEGWGSVDGRRRCFFSSLVLSVQEEEGFAQEAPERVRASERARAAREVSQRRARAREREKARSDVFSLDERERDRKK
jgi:hypothetical protein